MPRMRLPRAAVAAALVLLLAVGGAVWAAGPEEEHAEELTYFLDQEGFLLATEVGDEGELSDGDDDIVLGPEVWRRLTPEDIQALASYLQGLK